MRKKLHSILAVILLASSIACLPVHAEPWKAVLIPASLNADKTIQLAGGEIQPLNLTLQAEEAVTSRTKNHALQLEWDLPSGTDIVFNGGLFKLSNSTVKTQNGRTFTRFDAQVVNSAIAGAPGSRLGAEGRNQSFFVRVPQNIPAGQKYFRLKLTDGETAQNFEWPVKIITLTPPSQRPKRTTIGLWDYNYSRATNEIAANGIAKLFKDSGVNFTQGANDATYRKALQNQNIVTGGGTHHSFFRDNASPDYAASGKILAGSSYPDPQAILTLPQDADIPGVKQLVKVAKDGDGIATFDYEPNGLEGFSPQSTQLFKERYKISDVDFEKFRDYVAKNSFNTRLAQDKSVAEIWRHWAEFRSAQTSNYVRRIYEAVKLQAPDMRLAVTTSRGADKDSLGVLTLGVNNAAMAKFTDIIMPQLYSGYSGANAKLVMQMTSRWHDELQQQNAKTQLWPLLLTRYSGATVYNTPLRLRQQIIGSLAHGANGIGIYYAGNMDGSYWEMLARTTEDIAKYENFYQDGARVDQQFTLNSLPTGVVKVPMFPYYEETVQNSGWAFTAHQLEGKVLLTLINLEEANDLVFGIDIGKAKVLLTQDATKSATNQWLVAPGKIGFIVLEENKGAA